MNMQANQFKSNYVLYVARSGVEHPVQILADTRWEIVATANRQVKKGDEFLSIEKWNKTDGKYETDEKAIDQFRNPTGYRAGKGPINVRKPVAESVANEATLTAGAWKALASAARGQGIAEAELPALVNQTFKALASLEVDPTMLTGYLGQYFPALVRRPRQEATAQ